MSVNDQNYFLLISHTLERNKPSHSNQFYCKKNYYCIEKKIKILPFLQWIVIKCAKPLHPNPLPSQCFLLFKKKTPPAFSRVSTVFNNSWNDSATTYQHFWLRTTRVYHQNQKSKVPTTIISFSLQFSDQRDDNALLFNLEKKRENEWNQIIKSKTWPIQNKFICDDGLMINNMMMLFSFKIISTIQTKNKASPNL